LIDLDVPRNGSRVTLLHWFQPDVTGVVNGINSTTLTLPTTGPGAPYLQPSPPPGDAPHRYTFFLFEQPIDFTVPAAFASVDPPETSNDRVGFNLNAFIAAANLSAPLAANYMLVQNTTISGSSTSFPPSSVTSTAGIDTSIGSGTSSTIYPIGSPATAPASGTATATATVTSTGGSATATTNAAVSMVGGSGLAFVLAAALLVGFA
jgi:hypothetical protein